MSALVCGSETATGARRNAIVLACAVQRIDAKQLADAFASSAFFFDYQPIVDLYTAQVPYVEALVRWNHPTIGVLQPGSFLSLIHGAQLSDSFTDWSLQQVLGDLPQLRKIYGDEVAVTINLSQRQLVDPGATAARVAAAIAAARTDARSICIEVVEDMTTQDLRRSVEAIAGLRAIGVRVFLDDFGTGASSLTALTEMDYDGLKIDRSFVRGIVSGTTARSIVEAILTFGAQTGVSVVAEGVESALELQALNDIGCLLGQGYFLGRPTPLGDATALNGYVPTIRVTDDHRPGGVGLDAIMFELDQVDPRSTTESFQEIRQKLEQLDASAQALGADGDLVRCKIGRRLTLAAVYQGDTDTAVKWGLQTSRHAERIGEWGYCAEVLAVVAAGRSRPDEAPGLRIEAMTRALEIRMTKPIGDDRRSSIDNSIGAIFANLGLWDHAYRWWKDSLDRQTTTASPGAAMCCLNLIELELERLEGFVMMLDETPRELSIALVVQVLGRLEANPYVSSGASGGLLCRLELAQGNIDAAIAAIADLEVRDGDIIPHFLLLRARAMLAEALEDSDDFLTNTTALTAILDGHALLIHHDQQAQQLHVRALSAAGRHDEAIEVLERLLSRQRVEDGKNLGTLFGWIRVNVDLSLRFAELEALRVNVSS